MKVVCITNRLLCGGDFMSHIKKIMDTNLVESVYLREKDLSQLEYRSLLESILKVGNGTVKVFGVKYVDVTRGLGVKSIHLSYSDFLKSYEGLNSFDDVSVSVHSLDEAVKCETLGATRLVTGHIFNTESKKGLPPRGLDYLESVCKGVSIPVYAIGGVTSMNAKSIIERGASGICLMSSLMRNGDPQSLLKSIY